MKQRVSDQNITSFYEEISQYHSFRDINYFQSNQQISLNADHFTDPALYHLINAHINILKAMSIEELLSYRMQTYQASSIETIPLLQRLALNSITLEQLGSITNIANTKQALLNLIDFAIYSTAHHDASHDTFNKVREYIFTLEDYCLQVEHTKLLREECHKGHPDSPDTLQLELEEDLQKMTQYLQQILEINDLLFQTLSSPELRSPA